MLAKILSLMTFVGGLVAVSATAAQSASSQPDMVPNGSSTPACQLLTEKEVLDHIPTGKGVQIVAEDYRDSGAYSECTWMRKDFSANAEMNEPIILDISWESNVDNDYLIERTEAIGDPVDGIGDKAYWLSDSARPSLIVWYKDNIVTVQITGGEPNRASSKLAASRALRRIKDGKIKY